MRWRAMCTLRGGPGQYAAASPRRTQGTGRRGGHHRGPRVGQGQGIEVKDRGRVPAELVARFKAATGQ